MLISGVAAGILGGLIARGDPRRLAAVRVRWWPAFLLAVALRAIAGFPLGTEVQRAIYVLALWLLVAVALANLALPAAPGIVAGLTLNALVVTLNAGAMPVSASAALAATGRMPTDALHRELGPDAPLPFLADVLPVPLLGAYSIGDLVLALGVGALIFRVMTRP